MIDDVSGVVGWCLGAYSEVENTYVHRLHTFLHTGSGLYNPLQQSRLVSRPHILYNISTTDRQTVLIWDTNPHTPRLYFKPAPPLHLPRHNDLLGLHRLIAGMERYNASPAEPRRPVAPLVQCGDSWCYYIDCVSLSV